MFFFFFFLFSTRLILTVVSGFSWSGLVGGWFWFQAGWSCLVRIPIPYIRLPIYLSTAYIVYLAFSLFPFLASSNLVFDTLSCFTAAATASVLTARYLYCLSSTV